ncbi:carbohydrate porin [Pseudovibrio sp. Tun.PSC04-5.I4]|uniref:carbohydrate porin n=1 Tax=Pseudovibrio sp. Tun.PSC04-5.I4 TaxID=1798213 RepID=UPI000880154F|nr:carbohydrate porin [Pseudovibrio sp. Tun.PSC04-5.I4]SDR33793.1 porin, OprB family [Pseudovibrio sp. Tun.PSC04-5.I4]
MRSFQFCLETWLLNASAKPNMIANMLSIGLWAGILLQLMWIDEAAAQSSRWPLDWGDWQKGSGDWGGYRTNFEKQGVEFNFNFTSDVFANPKGGREQSAAYAGRLDASVDLNLEKLLGFNGGIFSFGLAQGSGQNLSEEAIGNIFGVAQVFGGDILIVSELKLSQTLWGDSINFEIGRLAAAEAFGGSEALQYYVNNGTNGTPSQFSINLPSYTSFPSNQWGVYARYEMGTSSYVSAGAYNASPNAQIDGNSGFNFRFNPDDGILYMGQTGFFVGQEGTNSGLPGSYQLGGFYDSSDYRPFVDPSSTTAGNWGFYAIADQMVYREKEDQGLTLWSVVIATPRQSINTFPWAWNSGLYYKGLLPNRDDDITAAAAVWGLFSEDLPDQSFELVFEVNHRFQFTP